MNMLGPDRTANVGVLATGDPLEDKVNRRHAYAGFAILSIVMGLFTKALLNNEHNDITLITGTIAIFFALTPIAIYSEYRKK